MTSSTQPIQQGSTTSNDVFYFPKTGIAVPDSALLLAIDDASFTLKHSVCLYLVKPEVRPEAVLRPEPQESNAPDNLEAHFYGTVLHEEGRFRMWYYACHRGMNPDWPAELASQVTGPEDASFIGPLCYAESADGIEWVKPNLGQVTFKGSRENNALALPHAIVSCATVIRDDAEADPTRRYKMVYQFFYDKEDPAMAGLTGFATCAMAVSPDGLQWTVLGTPYPHDFVEHASFYQHDGKYILNSHQHSDQVPGEGGTSRGRQGFVRLAIDFDHWLEGQEESFTLPEPVNPEERGILTRYDQVHLGTGATSFGTVCVGLYGLWHSANMFGDFADISCDLSLVISNDGERFREPVKGHIFLERNDSPAPTVPGKEFHTLLHQANGILNVGDQTLIYHGRCRNTNEIDPATGHCYSYAEVALATLPRDRWGGLGLFPEAQSGHFWTAPIVLPDTNSALFLNADDGTGISVEIADEKFNILPEYSGEQSGSVAAESGLDQPVQWPIGDLKALAGKTIRFKIHLNATSQTTPRVYAATLKKQP
jgi:hypothetical protein